MGATGHDEVSHATWRRAIAGTLATGALLVAGACGSGGDDATGDDDEVEGVPLDADAQASASDVEAVTGYVEDLLAGYEDAINAILVDQQATLDESSPEVEAYRDLFAPNGTAVDEVLEGWQANAEAGVRYEATEPGRPLVTSSLDGELEVVSEDEVRFPTCDQMHMQSFDADGQPIEVIDVVDQPGEGVAVRVGGRWYLQDMELFSDQRGCRSGEGAGTEDEEDA